MPEVTWGESGRAEVPSSVELNELLDSLIAEAESNQPFMAELTLDNGDSLSIGLGRAHSTLAFTPGSLDPPYYLSQGRGGGGSNDVIVFMYRGHWSEFPAHSAIPIDIARKVLLHFYDTGQVPNTIQWSEV